VSRDRIAVLAVTVISVLIAVPGVHLFEIWLPLQAARIVSHGLALLGLTSALWQWRRRRARAVRAASRAG
jgi:protein-S-isoprenylcysteine O-methyltransferase Ste14